MKWNLIDYTPINLFENIEKLVPSNNSKSLFDSDSNNTYYEDYIKSRKQQFENLLKKISLITNQSSYFLVENHYTEKVWKELYNLHFSNTSYAKSNKVIRIHFFNSNYTEKTAISTITFLKKHYLGYITLRPIPDFDLMLSFIIPNWSNLKFDVPIWLITYKKTVYVLGCKIEIKTLSFFSQDTVYLRCAHADIIMFNLIMHNVYHFPRMRIIDMIGYNRYYSVPNEGLNYEHMLDIFYNNKIPVNFYTYEEKAELLKENKDKAYEYALNHYTAIIRSHLESKLPVIVYRDNHVVLIVGHTDDDKFIVYDDSGYFIKNKTIFKDKCGFIGIAENIDLFPQNRTTNDGTPFMIAATFERIYLNPAEYFANLDEHMDMFDYLQEANSFLCRNMIIDNILAKDYLLKNMTEIEEDEVNEELINFINSDVPHYIWYSELRLEDLKLIFVADATCPAKTWERIFYLKSFYTCPLEIEELSLLTRIESK